MSHDTLHSLWLAQADLHNHAVEEAIQSQLQHAAPPFHIDRACHHANGTLDEIVGSTSLAGHLQATMIHTEITPEGVIRCVTATL